MDRDPVVKRRKKVRASVVRSTAKQEAHMVNSANDGKPSSKRLVMPFLVHGQPTSMRPNEKGNLNFEVIPPTFVRGM